MTSSPLFNGVASWNIRDENSGKFAPRRRAGADMALGMTDHTGAVIVATKTSRAPTERSKYRAMVRRAEQKAQKNSETLMGNFFADAECAGGQTPLLASAEWLEKHRVD